jgi:hypothetical protein
LTFISLMSAFALASPSWAAVSFVASGTIGSGTTTATPKASATVNSGDLLIACVGNKNTDHTPGTPTDAFGVGADGNNWQTLSNNQAISTNGETPADPDAGDVIMTVFYKVANGTEDSGNVSVVCTSCNVNTSQVFTYSNATGLWNVAAAQGVDNTKHTSISVASMTGLSTNGDIASGDMVVACSARSVIAGIAASAEAIATASVTYAANTEDWDGGTSFGNNVYGVGSHQAATAGSSTAGPTYSYTVGNSSINATVLIRLREVSAAATYIQGNQDAIGIILK